jgi:hypothetical protein
MPPQGPQSACSGAQVTSLDARAAYPTSALPVSAFRAEKRTLEVKHW